MKILNFTIFTHILLCIYIVFIIYITLAMQFYKIFTFWWNIKGIVHIIKFKDMLFCPTKPIFMKTEMNETYQNNIIVEHPIIASNSILLHTGTSHFIVMTSLQQLEESEVSWTSCSSINKTRSPPTTSTSTARFRLEAIRLNLMTNDLWYPS